jgi:hypothetical protein
MPIISLEAAKHQLNMMEGDDDVLISTLLQAAMGMVEHAIGRDVYQILADVPNDAVNFIVFSALKKSKQAVLQAAIMLALSTLYTYRESSLEVDLSENPAFKACLSGFSDVVVG